MLWHFLIPIWVKGSFLVLHNSSYSVSFIRVVAKCVLVTIRTVIPILSHGGPECRETGVVFNGKRFLLGISLV